MDIVIKGNTEELDKLEAVIQRNAGAFYEIGCALMEIRDKGLYRDVLGFETFEAYCKARWDFSKRHVYRLIDSANVVDTVKSDPLGHFPDNERQCRPLTKLEPDQQRIAWQQAVETAPAGKVTAAVVSKVVKGMMGEVEVEKIKRIKKPIEVIGVHEDFEKSYQIFYREVQSARLSNWQLTSKENALRYVNYIIDLINA